MYVEASLSLEHPVEFFVGINEGARSAPQIDSPNELDGANARREKGVTSQSRARTHGQISSAPTPSSPFGLTDEAVPISLQLS